jgi:hypothetical protein
MVLPSLNLLKHIFHVCSIPPLQTIFMSLIAKNLTKKTYYNIIQMHDLMSGGGLKSDDKGEYY